MALLARAWIGAGRARRRFRRGEPGSDPMALLRGPAPGRSVVDVGCVWAVDEARTEPFLATAIARPA